MTHSTSPATLDVPPVPCLLTRISSSAPPQPSSTPPALSQVIGSRRNSVASTMVSTGTMVAMIEVSMGEVSERPQRKSIWLSWMPNTEANSSSTMSRGATFSLGRKSDAVQNNRQAPSIRYTLSANGLTPCGCVSDQSTLLPIGALRPQMIFATQRAACPFSFPSIRLRD